MKVIKTDRGFELLEHPAYPLGDTDSSRLVQQSSQIGDYTDSFDRPGTSYLWVGNSHHLNREEVGQLVRRLQAWLDTGSLEVAAVQPERHPFPVYAIGIEHQPGSFGMTHGLTPDLAAMLEVHAGDDAAVIWRFDPDGTERITHRWRDGGWAKVSE